MNRFTGKFLVVGFVLAISGPSFSCSCASSTLENRYDKSANVFRAIVNSVEFVDCPEKPPGFPKDWDCGNYEAGFELVTKFKGKIPFDKIKSHVGGASCGTSLTVGKEYVFFTGDEGSVSLCSGTIHVSGGRELDLQRAKMLDDFAVGRISDLSNPWTSSEHNSACGLHTNFGVPTGQHGFEYSASLSARYRPAGINILTGEKDPSIKMEQVRIKLRLFTSDRTAGDFVWLSANGVHVKAVWTKEDLGYRAYVVGGQKAIAILKQLDEVAHIDVEGPEPNKRKLAANIRTTNAGKAIDEFLSCANLN